MDSTSLPCTLPLPDAVPFAFRLHALAAQLQTVRDQRAPRGVR